MKNTSVLKRLTALFLAALLAVGCLAGCDSYGEYEYTYEDNYSGHWETYPKVTMPDFGALYPDETEPAQTEAPTEPEEPGQLKVKDGEQIAYMMIYNPKIYTGETDTKVLQTGDLAAHISVDMNRGDGLGEAPAVLPFAQLPVDAGFLDAIDLDGGKADGLGKFYKVGDRENFYCGDGNDINTRTEKTFTCVYAGTHANIWTYEALDSAALNKLGQSFDATIYDDCVERFGEPRFGEVVNFLVYNFNGDQSTVGFFHSLDLFSTMECDDLTARQYGVNRNINVVNMNGLWLADEATTISTLAHEFQHLLCFTGYFSAGNECDVWFNEAMSAYIEEELYKGSKVSSVQSFHESQRIRNGQSLYNFGIDTAMFNFDIGVYGSVFLFAEYLKNLAGNDVFANFHANWRNTYVPMDTPTGIYEVIPESVRQQIDQQIQYPASYSFESEAQEFMSKLALSFYLSSFTADENSAENYRNLNIPYLLYDSMMAARIEGGGRVIFATKDGTFEIPEDADAGLVYVGLNENMEIVTNIVCK